MSHPSTPDDEGYPPTSPVTPTIIRWRCPNCGQIYFCATDEHPPDICFYCQDMTTWAKVDEH